MVIAALVCDHLECQQPGITLKDMDRKLSKDVFKHYAAWCKSKGALVSACSHRFSALRFGKDSWASCPELQSTYKAAVVKSMMYWCASYLRDNDTTVPGGTLRVNCMHAFTRFQNLIDLNGPFFDRETADKVVKMGQKALR